MAWSGARALAFVAEHGAVLQAGRGALPSLAEAIAGGPIRGSWWGHPKGKLIFSVLSELYDSPDVMACKLVGGKVTLIHRRLWPALGAAARDRRVPGLDRIRQEHMPSGEHRNFIERWPEWFEKERIARSAAIEPLPPALVEALRASPRVKRGATSSAASARGRAAPRGARARARRPAT